MKTENSVNNVSETRARMHLELQLSVSQYQLTGGTVTYCKPQRTPKQRGVKVKEKLVFGASQPKNRPSNAWDVLLTA